MANADILRRERKSRATQNKDHEIHAWVGGNTQNTNPTDVATAKKLLPVRTACALWGLRG